MVADDQSNVLRGGVGWVLRTTRASVAERRATRARAVMPAKSPAAMAAGGATQEPPTASTFRSAR
jgi:hypothetical protein